MFSKARKGIVFRDADPERALDALRWGVAIAQESGNRANETYLAMTLAMTLARIEAEPGDPLVALANITLAIRHYYNAGNTTLIRAALAVLALFLDRCRRYESAARIAGFALSPHTAATVPEFGIAIAHLRDILGDQTYEWLARKGETMTTAEVVTYAYDQIDQARTELEQPS